jgi:hypothetical protein
VVSVEVSEEEDSFRLGRGWDAGGSGVEEMANGEDGLGVVAVVIGVDEEEGEVGGVDFNCGDVPGLDWDTGPRGGADAGVDEQDGAGKALVCFISVVWGGVNNLPVGGASRSLVVVEIRLLEGSYVKFGGEGCVEEFELGG